LLVTPASARFLPRNEQPATPMLGQPAFIITVYSTGDEADANPSDGICQTFLNTCTLRAPDWWASPRFQAVCVAQSWFCQNGVPSSHPPAGNASRWAA
jgi:hypothetical protein